MTTSAVDTPPLPVPTLPTDAVANADLVHAILTSLAGDSGGSVPLPWLAAAATLGPAWRDATARVPSTLTAPTPAALTALAAAPAMLQGLTELDLTCTHDAATARGVAAAAARALRTGRARSLARVTSPRLSTLWLVNADLPSLNTVERASGPWASARGASMLPRAVRTLSLVAPTGPCRAPHPALLASVNQLHSLTLIGFDVGSASFDAAPPCLTSISLLRVRTTPGGGIAPPPSVRLPPAQPRLTRLTVSFDSPADRPSSRRRASPRGAVVAWSDVSAAAHTTIEAPGRALTVVAPLHGGGDAAADAAALLAEVVAAAAEAGTSTSSRLDLSADHGVRVGAATPADVAAAAAGMRGVVVEVASVDRLVVLVGAPSERQRRVGSKGRTQRTTGG